jgi:hypothetical protein
MKGWHGPADGGADEHNAREQDGRATASRSRAHRHFRQVGFRAALGRMQHHKYCVIVVLEASG